MVDKVSRLRQLMGEAVPRPAPRTLAEEDAWARFSHYAANSPEQPAIDDSERARAVRDINRIVVWYGMQMALTRCLDQKRVGGIASLTDHDVLELQLHFRQLEDCVQSGFDSPYAPPAG